MSGKWREVCCRGSASRSWFHSLILRSSSRKSEWLTRAQSQTLSVREQTRGDLQDVGSNRNLNTTNLSTDIYLFHDVKSENPLLGLFVVVSLCSFVMIFPDPREVWLVPYLVEHQCVKPQTEGHHQEQEEHHDSDQGPHDFAEHHHVDTETIKPGQTRPSIQQPARGKSSTVFERHSLLS